MRYAVDPGEPHTAAAKVLRVSDRTAAALQTIAVVNGSVSTWCPDAGLAGVVRDALASLEHALSAAGRSADATGWNLVTTAENYGSADALVIR